MPSAKRTKYRPRLPRGVIIYDVQCPVLHTLELVGGKWKLPILWHLADQNTVRYNALKRSVMGITNMMLNKCLKELEESGLVARKAYDEAPLRVEYSLTPCGQSLLLALRHLYAWGEDHIRQHSSVMQSTLGAPEVRNGLEWHSLSEDGQMRDAKARDGRVHHPDRTPEQAAQDSEEF